MLDVTINILKYSLIDFTQTYFFLKNISTSTILFIRIYEKTEPSRSFSKFFFRTLLVFNENIYYPCPCDEY